MMMTFAKRRGLCRVAALIGSLLTAEAGMAESSRDASLTIDAVPARQGETAHDFVCPARDGGAPTKIGFIAPGNMFWSEIVDEKPVFDTPPLQAAHRIALGYVPEERDRLEISLICAGHDLDLVAAGSDLGRALLQDQGADLLFGESHGLDAGDVLGEQEVGNERWRDRIGTWRLGSQEVILHARYNADAATAIEPMLGRIFGTFAPHRDGRDPVAAGMRIWPLRFDDKTLTVSLPGNWESLAVTPAGNGDGLAAFFRDKNDTGGDVALALLWGETSPQKTERLAGALGIPDDPALHPLIAAMLDLEISNLLPLGAEYSYQGERVAVPPPGRRIGLGQQSFTGVIILGDEQTRIASDIDIVLGKGQMAILGLLGAMPDSASRRARYMHASFAYQTLLGSLRRQDAFRAD
ncbi:hypothetical protein [Rhodovulum sulfidophilum]|uniref:hypothetical protein n=1 Tax=Rhodovulum sulfidophilum TaxID=35806 RepID=UPI00138A510F|nr:hypothetical protein [Rhodovulum sulfidophilum]NDK36836.1 hypothetical protein [Rhodovulum sulfidophilum]